MADILVIEEEDLANSDDVGVGEAYCRLPASFMDGGGEGIVGVSSDKDGSVVNPYDCLPPVDRLEKYISEHKLTNKRGVAQAVLDTLRMVSRESPLDVTAVLRILSRLAEDSDVQLRTEVMVQVPQIAILCYEVVEQLSGVVEGHLLPLVIKTLTDIEESVRTTAQTALIVLMEQNLVTREAIEDQVCPVILMLAEMGTLPDYHSSAVTLMSKIAPLVGREKAMELFLDHFVVLCSDPAFFVRTVCATNIGDFCTLMGTEVTEHVLLLCFVQLCKDSVWGVRKECADVFLSVSCVVSLSTRKKVLAPIFVELLRDQSRWVKIAAFHSLGPFIWTFAPDSNKSVELQSPANEPNTPQRSSHPQNKIFSSRNICFGADNSDDLVAPYLSKSPVINNSCDTALGNIESEKADEQSESSMANNENVGVDESSGDCNTAKVEVTEPENDFNTFLFWRLPLPDVGPNLAISGFGELDKCSSADKVALESEETSKMTASRTTGVPSCSTSVTDPSTVDREKMDVSWFSPNTNISLSDGGVSEDVIQHSTPNSRLDNKEETGDKSMLQREAGDQSEIMLESNPGRLKLEIRQKPFMNSPRCSSEGWSQSRKTQVPARTPFVQDIVPQALIDHFVSMSTPSQFYEDETEFTHHCAFNLPAVALTLGRENWPLLSTAYEVLAVDVQWKVRRTLASSIHELAVILGEELATRYLVPIFSGFIKDLDEVRIGVVKHLADFLKLVSPVGRNECLPSLSAFLTTDNELNWRFRDELTKQLLQVTNLFPPSDVSRFLTPFGISLLMDKVAAVRQTALLLVTQHVRYLSVDKDLVESLLVSLAKEFARSGLWVRRQSYACLCDHLLVSRPLQEAKYIKDGDEEDDEEGVERGLSSSGDYMLEEWIDDGHNETAWRARIGPLLAQHVYPYLLDLSCDKVPNVRLAVARVLGSFQATPTEQSYLQSYLDEAGESDGDDTKRVPALEMALAQLQKDTDRDVRHYATRNQLSCSSTDSSGHKLSCQAIEEELDVVHTILSKILNVNTKTFIE